MPECLAEADHIPVGLGIGEILLRRLTAPDPQAIEEVEPLTVPNRMPPTRRIGPEVDRTGENPLETLNQPAVMRSIFRQIKVFEDLGGGPKHHVPGLLPNGKGGDPNWDEPVLPERKSILRVSGHLQPEPAIPERVLQGAGGRATNR